MKRYGPFFTTLFMLLVVLVSLLESCQSSPERTTSEVLQSDTLSNKLDEKEAKVLIANFEETVNQNIDDDFFFDGVMENSSKVVSFLLNEWQAKEFFEELDSLKNVAAALKDSVEIRIHMAFRGKQGSKWSKESNLAPLMEVILRSKGNITGQYYPLRPTKIDTLFAPENSPVVITIPITEAKKLVDNWEKIAIDDITEQLYLDQSTGAPGGRINYYTFDPIDTENIHNYQKALGDKKCYVYVHLGHLPERGYVPLRTIIHIDDNPAGRKKSNHRSDGDTPEYFEFSKPCPNYCD